MLSLADINFWAVVVATSPICSLARLVRLLETWPQLTGKSGPGAPVVAGSWSSGIAWLALV
jgi:hypothetical protein